VKLQTVFASYLSFMRKKKSIFLIIFIFLLLMGEFWSVYAQSENKNIQENYVHYTLESGLPTTVIYNCVQDKNGFIWFGSYAGLIRFDGHDFYTFTQKNGLPDNEIISINADSLGRVWAYPYSKRPIFISQNKVYTHENNDLLKKIENSNLLEFQPSYKGGMWVLAGDKNKGNIYHFCGKNQVKSYAYPNATSKSPSLLINYKDSSFQILRNDSLFFPEKKIAPKPFALPYPKDYKNVILEYHSQGFYLIFNLKTGCIIQKYQNLAPDYVPKMTKEIALPHKIMNSYFHKEKLYLSLGAGGYLAIDDDYTKFDSTQIILKDAYVGGMTLDSKGNLWLATMGQGIYCIPAKPVYRLKKEEFLENKNITQSIFKDEDGELFVGNSGGEIQRFTQDYSLFKKKTIGTGQYNRILRIEKSTFNPQDLYIVCDDGFFVWHNYKSHSQEIEKIIGQATKCLYQSKFDKIVYIGTSNSLYRYDLRTQVRDTLARKRVTAIWESQAQKVYFGSLDGLYVYENNSKAIRHLAAENPQLNCRLVALLGNEDNSFWMATSSSGLLLVKDNKILKQIDKSQGLATDMLTCLYRDKKGYLWVGSINGLHKIRFENGDINKMHISFYNTRNGLLENTINQLITRNDSVFVATYKGLSFFKDFLNEQKSLVKTQITNVAINGKDTLFQEGYILSFNQNTLTVSFTAICFDCNEEIYYHYRLLGKQNSWQTTNQREIQFGALEPGEYLFEVYAMGENNPIKRTKFLILPPWWRETWVIVLFILLLLAAITGISAYLFSLYQKRIHDKHQEEKKLKELEIQAIRSQMNPHFIFNCLSSIQYFINSGEIQEANLYMDKFAKLIRRTLNFSQNAMNTVEEEVSYIDNYLQLEQMRFEDKFQYEIIVSDEIEVEDVYLPSLILQPFVENAIRHGLRFKAGKEGKLWVRFYKKDDFLICEIEDNGIGREKAAELKSKQHIEYQSQGMKLSQSRLTLFNTDEVEKMKMEVIDLKDNSQNASGTLIRVFISLDC
jgi:ligand-binding sensor domain-containing protein